jgi:biotin transport system substrate-specific component
MLLGSIVIYAVALPWLHHVLASSTIEETLQAGLYPFIIGDTLKLLAAAGVLPAAWALMKKPRPRNRISSEED